MRHSVHPTKTHLIETAVALLEEKMPHEIAVDEILEKSGISKGSLYHHFEDLAELLESVRQMKRGEGRVVYSPVIDARRNSGLSQTAFAELLGVSVRPLQGWEQGRKQPSGAARTLITLVQRHPNILLKLAQP